MTTLCITDISSNHISTNDTSSIDTSAHTSAAAWKASDEAWAEADALLARMAELEPGDRERANLRDQVICCCAPEARREARRFRRTSETLDDLVQVATVGLILAVDRFDPARGIPFRGFAIPTITGEIKRHFRDKGWGIRVSRRIQEHSQEVRRAEPLLAQRLGRMPTVHDLAEHLGLSDDDVRAARQGEAFYTLSSLNFVATGGDDTSELSDRLGDLDRDIESVPDHDALVRAWPMLPDRSRVILSLRFVDDLSQSQIAEKMGLSQMHVSRLISRSLDKLRRHMVLDEPSTRTGAMACPGTG